VDTYKCSFYACACRGRPNLVFFFVFGAEKRIFIFLSFIFLPKKIHIFSVYFFGRNMAVKITENS